MKKDGSISKLKVGKLASLVPADTVIYFKDLGSDRPDYCVACEEEITWQVKEGVVLLHAGEDDACK